MTNNKKSDKKGGIPFEVPVEGSLGLLALGATGLKAWREKKAAVKRNRGKNKNGE